MGGIKEFLNTTIGSGYGYGDGSGYGYGSGIKSYCGEYVYNIDGVATVIKNIRGAVANGFIVNRDLTKTNCFIVKQNNLFAHGKTIKGAMSALHDKLFDNMSEEERIDSFIDSFPRIGNVVANSELFIWHNRLTGSCEIGRDQFVKDNEIDLSEEMSVGDFINLTKNSYGGNIIKKLAERYV